MRNLPIMTSTGTFWIVHAFDAERLAPKLDAEVLSGSAASWTIERWIASARQSQLDALLRDLRGSWALHGSMRTQDATRELHRAFESGQLRVLLRARKYVHHLGERPEERAPVAAPVEQPWVEFLVVDDVDATPLPGIKLKVRLGDGTESERTTNAEGLISIDPAPLGVCKISTDIRGIKFEKTYGVSGTGGARPDPPAGDAPKKPSELRLAKVEQHKVRTGETLQGLAERVGLTWQELATFNFGTTAPSKLDMLLRTNVGCTRRTKDGKNYRFDDSDTPGMLYIPTPLNISALNVNLTHVIHARPLLRARAYVFSH